jgi:hypothetical protein
MNRSLAGVVIPHTNPNCRPLDRSTIMAKYVYSGGQLRSMIIGSSLHRLCSLYGLITLIRNKSNLDSFVSIAAIAAVSTYLLIDSPSPVCRMRYWRSHMRVTLIRYTLNCPPYCLSILKLSLTLLPSTP